MTCNPPDFFSPPASFPPIPPPDGSTTKRDAAAGDNSWSEPRWQRVSGRRTGEENGASQRVFDAQPSEAVWPRLEAACRERGWNLCDLAREAKVSRGTLYSLQNGTTRSPHRRTLARLEATLGLSRPTAPRGSGSATHGAATAGSGPLAQRSRTVLSGLNDDGLPLFAAGPSSASRRGAARRFDQTTNPAVDEVVAQRPDLFVEWEPSDWDELYSSFGVGGALAPAGVVQTAEQMNERREAIFQLSVLLETHLRDSTLNLLRSLFQTVQVDGNLSQEAEPAGWAAPRLPSPGDAGQVPKKSAGSLPAEP